MFPDSESGKMMENSVAEQQPIFSSIEVDSRSRLNKDDSSSLVKESTKKPSSPLVLRSRDFLVGAGASVRSGSGSILDKTEEILNDFFFVHSHID